jgi:acetyl esterase
MMKWFWDSYTTDQRERHDVYASPFQSSIERLRGVPPALIQTAEMDGATKARPMGARWIMPAST